MTDAVAHRVLDALPTVSGTVLVRDRCGRDHVVDAVVDECRRRGLDPVVENVSNEDLRTLIASSTPTELARWDLERADVTGSVNGLIVLGGWAADLAGLPAASVGAWASAAGRVERALERRHVPTVVVAVPTDYVAQRLGMELAELEARVLPALLMTAASLNTDIASLVSLLTTTSKVDVLTGAGTLTIERGDRPLMIDDGVIDDADIACGAGVSNLPAGSTYWTVVEDTTRGDIALADGSLLRFDGDGRVIAGPYAGERISHVGIATNAQVSGTIGWTIVDEHRRGARAPLRRDRFRSRRRGRAQLARRAHRQRTPLPRLRGQRTLGSARRQRRINNVPDIGRRRSTRTTDQRRPPEPPRAGPRSSDPQLR